MRFVVFLVVLLSLSSSQAVVFYIEGLPSEKVYVWSRGSSESTESQQQRTDQYNRILVNIPDEYVVSTDKNNIDLQASLEKWRANTPVGPTHPLTKDGVARYPFRLESDPIDPRQTIYKRSLELGELLKKVKDVKSLRVSSGDGRMVEMQTEKPTLIRELEKIKETSGPVSCRKPKTLSSPALWTAAECMLCNCANESLTSAPKEDRIEIHKVALRRLVSSNEEVNKKVFYQHPAYGRSICGTILGKRKYSEGIALQFSWTSGPPRQTIFEMPAMHGSTMAKPGKALAPGRKHVLGDCVDTAIKALTDTINGSPGAYDHYHNTDICPDWARNKNGCRVKPIHLHKFYTLYDYTDGNMHLLKAEMGASEPAIIRPLETDFWPEGGNPSETSN